MTNHESKRAYATPSSTSCEVGALCDVASSWRVRVGRIGPAGQTKVQRREQLMRYRRTRNLNLAKNDWHGSDATRCTRHGFGIGALAVTTILVTNFSHDRHNFGRRVHFERHGAGLNIRQAHA